MNTEIMIALAALVTDLRDKMVDDQAPDISTIQLLAALITAITEAEGE